MSYGPKQLRLSGVTIFTCILRPAGLLVTLVVVVVVGGRGNNFYTLAFQRAHVWFWQLSTARPHISFFFKSPCMVWMLMYGRGGHTLFQNHSGRFR